ncbi:MAG: hypothetical protein MUP82_11035 [Candidatus Marinimicrobia bacterium]|nr:hypothetical protein [Candidatus Neomarinimicrobiota bacterium]
MIISILIVITGYFVFFKQSETIYQDDDNYMKQFDVYGDILFQMYGIISLIKEIYIDIDNFDEFNQIFNDIKHMLQHKEGDSILIKQGKFEFSTKIVQKKYKNAQTYLEVLYPINDQYYIIFDRIIKYLNLTDVAKTGHPVVSGDKQLKLIADSKISSTNRDFLIYLSKNERLLEFTNALGYCYVLQHFIHKYDSLDKGLAVIKKYNYLFMTRYGEGIFVWKNINNFLFENNNEKYIFQGTEWVYFYNTVVEKYKKFIGKSSVAGNAILQPICEKANTKCDLTDVISNIVETLIHKNSIVKYQWFNNIFLLPNQKISVVFKFKDSFYGSGFNFGA